MAAELKELVLEHSGFDAAISGGNGRSIDSAIIIHQDGVHDKRTVQKAVLWALGRHKDLSWDVLSDAQEESNGRYYESMLLDVRVMNDFGKVQRGKQTIYFDITELMSC
ncbi:hypothetical protein [Neptunomonas sp.]|uniref:hypothetical protein n=1 Tax=Neptunomonas sp. TaxID=1971898 RepID=UPI0025DE8B85|nr:hypothetical protein [Neptunomonas sp.]